MALRFASVSVLAVFAGGCEFVFPPGGPPQQAPLNSYFVGCFRGPVLTPPGVPEISIVFQAPEASPGLTLTGCLVPQGNPQSNASFSGTVHEGSPIQADLVLTPVAGGAEAEIIAERAPPGAEPATRISLGGLEPAFTAPNLSRCSDTCLSLGVVVP